MQAVLLAGGFGTRLQSVVSDRPKPMAMVDQHPFLHYLLVQLKQNGILEILFAIGYRGEMIQEYFGSGESYGMHFQYSKEKEALGTAGAIKQAEPFLQDRFFLLNADTFFQFSYIQLKNLAESENFDAVMVLREVEDISRYGQVLLEGNRITEFCEPQVKKSHQELGSLDTPRKTGLINGGVYYIKKDLLNMIPAQQKISLEQEIFPKILEDPQKKIGGLVREGYFMDIGVPHDYFQFVEDMKVLNLL
ncbi:nucleoside-diphosphate-sugar pyrophosphorylase [Clostridia bacterium]|nr:nucleoside-diphosphate-sugar pyrophosphorylase [Clostridia bacterium]